MSQLEFDFGDDEITLDLSKPLKKLNESKFCTCGGDSEKIYIGPMVGYVEVCIDCKKEKEE